MSLEASRAKIREEEERRKAELALAKMNAALLEDALTTPTPKPDLLLQPFDQILSFRVPEGLLTALEAQAAAETLANPGRRVTKADIVRRALYKELG